MNESANQLLLLRPDNIHFALSRDVQELLVLQVLQLLAAGGELLVEFDALFLHDLVGLLGAADEVKVLAAGDADVPVLVVQSDAKDLGFLARLNHSEVLLSVASIIRGVGHSVNRSALDLTICPQTVCW